MELKKNRKGEDMVLGRYERRKKGFDRKNGEWKKGENVKNDDRYGFKGNRDRFKVRLEEGFRIMKMGNWKGRC